MNLLNDLPWAQDSRRSFGDQIRAWCWQQEVQCNHAQSVFVDNIDTY